MKMQHFIEQAKDGSIRAKADRPLVETTSLPAPKMLPAMPIEISHSPLKVEVGYERVSDDVLFRFRLAERQPEFSPNLEAFHTREAFLEVKTPGEAMDFLSVTGHFRLQDKQFPKKHETLSWGDFRQWQELVRILMQTGSLSERAVTVNGKHVGTEFAVPEPLRPLMGELSFQEMMWLRGVPDGLSIHPVPESTKHGSRNQLKAQIAVHSTLEAIFAAVYVDTLNGIQYGKCGYCQGLFEIYTRHEREYCSTVCAQKAGVRRRRAQAKSATVKPKSGKAKGTTRKAGK
jgi:hypothetical protein